jgi:hypothetical protein
MTTLFFAYSIVPSGQDQRLLVCGVLYVDSLEEAKHHVQTLKAPAIAGKSDVEVILRDIGGSVIWRGPYLGADSNA